MSLRTKHSMIGSRNGEKLHRAKDQAVQFLALEFGKAFLSLSQEISLKSPRHHLSVPGALAPSLILISIWEFTIWLSLQPLLESQGFTQTMLWLASTKEPEADKKWDFCLGRTQHFSCLV